MTARNSVGVNLLWLIPGVVGGSEDYTVGLLNAIAGHEHDLALTLYCQPALLRAYPHLGDRYRVETLPVAGDGISSRPPCSSRRGRVATRLAKGSQHRDHPRPPTC